MSLLNEDISTAPDSTPGTSESIAGEPAAPSWYWDENTPGTGERPSYLPEKYKSVAEVAKAQRELESRLGSAPQAYDFSKGESWIETEYEPFIEMAEFAKSNHVPQVVMDKFLGSVTQYFDEFKSTLSEEKARLGENATERLTILNNWAKSNLSEKSFASLSAGMRTAESIEALEEIREKMLSANTMVPSSNSSTQLSSGSLEDYRSELNTNFAKYKNDPHYRKEMERKLESIMSKQNR